jgi:aspartyl-tRNA(Asn)/glutamyl-tRNA(Gln) amidotransferase subunit C
VIEDRDVEHVARLARLSLSEEERVRMREQLRAIVRYIDALTGLSVEGVEPTAHAVALVNVMRDDQAEPCLDRDAMMANAPDRAGEFFRVPRIIED